MPALEHMDLVDKAILWEVVRHDKHGQPLLSSPVEIRCRWEEGDREAVDAHGQEIVVDAILATNRNIGEGALLWEGSQEELEELDNETPTSNIYQMIFRVRAKDLKGRIIRYEFALNRFKDKLPRVIG